METVIVNASRHILLLTKKVKDENISKEDLIERPVD